MLRPAYAPPKNAATPYPEAALAEIINLRQIRKETARKTARQQADENAVKFGRTKGQKAREALDQARAKAELDGKKTEKAGDD